MVAVACQVPLDHVARIGVGGARALRSAALHDGDAQRSADGHGRWARPRPATTTSTTTPMAIDTVRCAGGRPAGSLGGASAGTYGDGPGQREPDLEHHPRQQQCAADAHDAQQRPRRLADGQAGDRHATEGHDEPDRLDEGVRRGPADHPPHTGGRHQRGQRRGSRRTAPRRPGSRVRLRNHRNTTPGNNQPAANSHPRAAR